MPTTITYNRGDVVLLPFPFSDQSSAKIRPAVVANPSYPSNDLLVAAITSIGNELRPGEFAIERWHETGLLHPSFVKRAIASVTGQLVRRQLGRLDQQDLIALDGALRLRFRL